MPRLDSFEVMIFLLQISLILISGKLLGSFFKKLGQPPVIGEILAGILIGPTVFAKILPNLFGELFLESKGADLALDGLLGISVLFLMFNVGMEINLNSLAAQGKKVLVSGALGILVPLAMGFGLGWTLYPYVDVKIAQPVFALFLGSVMSISALPVIAKILSDLKMLKTEFGSLVMGATTINDLAGWLLFTVTLGLAGGEGSNLSLTLAGSAILAFATIFILPRILFYIISKFNTTGNFSFSLGLVLGLMFIIAIISEYVGIHSVFGAFLTGIAVAKTKHFPSNIKHSIEEFTGVFFSTLFFTSIGLKADFASNFNLILVFLIVLVACFSKLFSGIVSSWFTDLRMQESVCLGFALIARGGMGIIVASIAFKAGVVSMSLFSALIVMAVLTSIVSGIALKIFQRRFDFDTEPGLDSSMALNIK